MNSGHDCYYSAKNCDHVETTNTKIHKIPTFLGV